MRQFPLWKEIVAGLLIALVILLTILFYTGGESRFIYTDF
jgi:hypothetical protein